MPPRRAAALLLVLLASFPRLASATCGVTCEGELVDGACAPLPKDAQGAQPLPQNQPALLAVRCSTQCCAPGGPCSSSSSKIEATALSVMAENKIVETSFSAETSPSCGVSQIFSFSLDLPSGTSGQLLVKDSTSAANLGLTSFVIVPTQGQGGAAGQGTGEGGAGQGAGASGSSGQGTAGQGGSPGGTGPAPVSPMPEEGCSAASGGARGASGFGLLLGLVALAARRRRP
jgi:MYXO-CTERM domain-containing protein